MKKLSERFQYYSGILCATGMNVDINDLVHISALLEAEEQGLLLKLPCKVGNRTYQVVMKYERVKKGGCTCCTTACGSDCNCDYFIEDECTNPTGNSDYQIISRGFKLEDFANIGKTVFLTKEEAEQKLKELQEKEI